MLDLRAYNDVVFRVNEVLNQKLYNLLPFNKLFCYKADEVNTTDLMTHFDLTDFTPSQANQILKTPLKNFFIEGTKEYINKNLQAFYPTAKVSQWYEYGGKPYHFKLSVDVSKNGFNNEQALKADELALKLKNVRSTYDGINIRLNTNINAHVGAMIGFGETIKINPRRINFIRANDCTLYYGGAQSTLVKLVVNPLPQSTTQIITSANVKNGAIFSIHETIIIKGM